jgi:arsenite methyltransferase
MSGTAIKEQVRAAYGATARRVSEGASDCGCGPSCCAPAAPVAEAREAASCCAPATSATEVQSASCCGGTAVSDPMAERGYRAADIAALPELAVGASLGCGNPTALIDLRPGETVLDLGSGGGIDVLLSARRVGPTGKAIGLDMTDEMLALARRNAADAGVANVEFLKGEIEAIPLPDASVDVIISNCVINLSPDKGAVLAEAFRVLRPGGRFAVSDIVAQGASIPPALRADMAEWASCASGAMEEGEYRAKLRTAGFGEPEVVVTGESACGAGETAAWQAWEGRLVSAFVRATKPLA